MKWLDRFRHTRDMRPNRDYIASLPYRQMKDGEGRVYTRPHDGTKVVLVEKEHYDKLLDGAGYELVPKPKDESHD